jgi:hypothetical protein
MSEEAAYGRLEMVVDWYIRQYRQSPYEMREFLRRVARVTDAKVGQSLLLGRRRGLQQRATRAAQAVEGAAKRGRPSIPDEVLDEAVALAITEHEQNGKPYTVDGAYKFAAERLHDDFGIIVGADKIKKHRERSSS